MQKVQNILACLILRAPRHQNCTPLLHSNSTGSEFQNELKHKTARMCYNAVTCSAPLPSTVLYNPSCSSHSLSDARMLNSNFNPWLSRFVTLWSPHLEQSPPKHQELCYSLFLQHQTQDISLRIFKLSNTVLHHHLSVQYVCACMCVYVCVHACVCVSVCVCVCASCPVMF